MKRTIFYSWQSDSEASTNRNFIEDALRRSLRELKRDQTVDIEPVLDRDTSGLSGSPAIADSIFAKIALADVFVADVTPVQAPRGPSRLASWLSRIPVPALPKPRRATPNPNVLVELGFATSTLGWERIILLQNTAYGPPNDLPFDLRGRRIVTYALPPKGKNRSEVRGLLQGRLEAALRLCLADSQRRGVLAGPNVPVWFGDWYSEREGASWGGHLFIREVSSGGFFFDTTVFSGAHMGHVFGTARIVSPDLAYARFENQQSEQTCELSFHRSLVDGRRRIEVEEKGSCHWYRGMGVTFDRAFIRMHDGLFDGGFLDELDLQRLYSITGQYFSQLSGRFQLVADQETKEDFVARAFVGAPRALFTIMEGIVMRDEIGRLWAAFIDDDCVKYFTTEREYLRTLPKTFEVWRERFRDKQVEFVDDVDRIPKGDY